MSRKILPVLPSGKPWGIVAGPNHLRKEDCSRMSDCLSEVARLSGNGRCPENCSGYDKQVMHATSYSGVSPIVVEEHEPDEYRTGEVEMTRSKPNAVCVRCGEEYPLTGKHFPMVINRRTKMTVRSIVCRDCLNKQRIWDRGCAA